MGGSRKAACREIANIWLVFHSSICHTPCLSHKHLREPYWLMNHMLKATGLETGGIVRKHNCKDKKEGDTEYQEEGNELCHFFDLHWQIRNIHI